MPIVVISPVLRPDAEDVPNKLGATLADIRHAIESATRDRIVAGDTHAGPGGRGVHHQRRPPGDGIHPDDEGHKRIAATVAKALTAAMRAAAECRAPSLDEAARTLGDVPSR